MTRMPPLVVAVIAATLVLLVGTSLVQATTSDNEGDPIASVDNGAPRGLLLLRLVLEAAGQQVVVADTDEALDAAVTTPTTTLIVVPPPERASFSRAEAERLRAVVERGAVVVVACDGNELRRKRVQALLLGTGLSCVALPESAAASAVVDVDVGGVDRVAVLDRGRVSIDEERAGLLPWSVVDDDNHVVAASAIGAGDGALVVLGSMSLLSNDGLRSEDNRALLAHLRRGRSTVVVDERHHQTRFDAVVARARLQGPGPMTALVCLLVLVPLSLLAWLPRRGTLLDDDDDVFAPGTAERVAGLAALLSRTTPSTTTASASTPPAPGAVP